MCTAPSKTFNLAGLQASNIIVPGSAIRARLKSEISRTGLEELNVMGLLGCKAAYLHGEAWLDELRDYLRGNLRYMRDYLRENLPMLRLIEPEGTYLAWVDFSALGLTSEQLHDLIANRARLWLDDGDIFGRQGEGFQRFVLACPRATLAEAMERLKKAILDR